eukprot:TRINITY_DN60387_c0_g1_i1.p2 TRINITY_DN60387_c0_g1~~TRINITY_DN60387_c0_g1_i1.p2  ORF type:complete len:419 (-),score=123.73 TRINITY_DN60387_c0_g1_i1:365-1621(-)
MAAKTLVIPKGTPFLPLASARLPPKPLSPERSDIKFRNFQAISNGVPRKYTRRNPHDLDSMVVKFQDLYAEYPPVSKEVVEAHRRLGYPEHYVRALETGEYKVMTRPPKKEDGSEDLEAFESYWSFDYVAAESIRYRKRWLKATEVIERYIKEGIDLVLSPRLDWNAMRRMARFTPSDFEQLRLSADRAMSEQLRPLPGTMEKLWQEYNQADEDEIADDLADIYAEKTVEIAAMRRLALLRWMESRGDINPHDALDFLPKTRDSEHSLQQVVPFFWRAFSNDIEVSTSSEIPSWQDMQDAINTQHHDWTQKDVHDAEGGALTASALLQQKVNNAVGASKADGGSSESSSVSKGRDSLTSMELLLNRDKINAENVARMPPPEKLDLFTRSLLKGNLAEDWETEYNRIRNEAIAKVSEAS